MSILLFLKSLFISNLLYLVYQDSKYSTFPIIPMYSLYLVFSLILVVMYSNPLFLILSLKRRIHFYKPDILHLCHNIRLYPSLLSPQTITFFYQTFCQGHRKEFLILSAFHEGKYTYRKNEVL